MPVVHDTLKDIHDHVLKKKPGSLDAARVKDYFDQNKGNIATRDDFFRILDMHTDVDYSDIVRGYFQNR